MSKTAEQCIQKILCDIDRRKAVDFGDKNSVRRYNAAMDRIYANGKYIDSLFPEKINLLVELLYHHDKKVVLTVATLIQNLDNPSIEQRREVLHVAQILMKNGVLSPIEKLGLGANIETWERKWFAGDKQV